MTSSKKKNFFGYSRNWPDASDSEISDYMLFDKVLKVFGKFNIETTSTISAGYHLAEYQTYS